MGIDETGNQNAIGGIDDCHGVTGYCNIWPDLTDLAILDQHVRLREVTDLSIKG